MSENDNEQQVEIGKELRKARQEKGYTLDDLQQLTKIQKRYLIAIEDEKFNELPGDFYVRAFVKQYADTVGLDGNELLKEFNEQLPKTKSKEYSDHISKAVETRASHHKTVSQGVSKLRQYLPTIIIAAVIIIILGAIWLTAIVRGRQDSSTRIDNSSVAVSGESGKKSSSSSNKKTTKTSKSTAVKLTETNRTNTSVTYTASSLKKATPLQIKTSTQAWNNVVTDGATILNKTMKANATENLTIKKTTKSIVITVGNAAGTTIKFGNKKVNFTNNGKNTSVKTITINLGSSTASSSASSSSTTSQSTSIPSQTRTSTAATAQTTQSSQTIRTTTGTQTTATSTSQTSTTASSQATTQSR